MMTDFLYNSVDTHHLPFNFVTRPFTITAAHLARLVESCHYPIRGEKVLFGIRSAHPLSEKGCWHTELTLQESVPDHKRLHCTLGIWDRTSNKLAAFSAATVPHIHHVLEQIQNKDQRIANLLAQGLHEYHSGAHEPEGRPKEEGAFRLSRMIHVGVWRLFEIGTLPQFDACLPDDHIHAAHETPQRYKSGGCQVISGQHAPPDAPTGEYQTFRILAGQAALPNMAEIMWPYPYILTHGRHLFALTQGFNEPRFLQGSTGKTVRLIQEALITQGFLTEGVFNKGHINGKIAQAIYKFQRANNHFADAILKPDELKMLKVPHF